MNREELADQFEFFRDIGISHVDIDPPQHVQPARAASGPVVAGNPAAAVHESSAPDISMTLETIREDLGDCQRCRLAQTRTHIVYGSGSPDARLVFVAEVPGSDEDRQGLPFVGRAGQLLTRIIESIGLKRDDVYICNVLKCRPPGNRNPEPVEVETCSPFLRRQIAAIQPKIVCCLGTFAAQTVMRMKVPISRLRGEFHEIDGIRYIATFHPAYLLRNAEKKREVWEDMKKIRAALIGS